ncbi:unnamed protein product [marine sediment metagenome]|uniref:Uncharacterized protein n=1 Tax=marine sediment metagenome TaxID=412755 RepID=X0VX03_9ZZZZ
MESDFSDDIENIKKFFEIEENYFEDLNDKVIWKYKINFKQWFEQLIKNEPFSEKIKGLIFGLFEVTNGATLYLAGSERHYNDGVDWVANPEYWPDGRYFNFPELKTISNTLKSFKIEMWEFVLAITIIIVKDYFQTNIEYFKNLVCRSDLIITIGFDDGDFDHFELVNVK